MDRKSPASEAKAIDKLIREIDRLDELRNIVPRRIFLLFAIVLAISFSLLIFALTYRRRDRPTRTTPP